jgi:hypothetical protein
MQVLREYFGRARADAQKRIRAEPEAKHRKLLRRLVESMIEAEPALQDLQRLEAQYEPNIAR